MTQRIRAAAKSVATSESRDLVTRKDDIVDKQGRDVVDLTDKVVSKVSE
jgi:Skp family chaperone for outer membrane proteins